MIHCRLASVSPRSFWIDGSATFTIVESSTTMNCARQISTSTTHGFVSFLAIFSLPSTKLDAVVRLRYQNRTGQSGYKVAGNHRSALCGEGGERTSAALRRRRSRGTSAATEKGRKGGRADRQPLAGRGPAPERRADCPRRRAEIVLAERAAVRRLCEACERLAARPVGSVGGSGRPSARDALARDETWMKRPSSR